MSKSTQCAVSLMRNQVKAIFSLCGDVMRLIRRSPSVVISRVNGVATAAGAQLVATSDLAVATSHSTFATPGMSLSSRSSPMTCGVHSSCVYVGVRVGLYCTTPGVAVSRSVPAKTAFRMLATGRPITAHEALQQGLISHVVDGQDGQQATETMLDDNIAEIVHDIINSGSQVCDVTSTLLSRRHLHRPLTLCRFRGWASGRSTHRWVCDLKVMAWRRR